MHRNITLIIFFFFLMIRRPPRSTLFPYTTLFRSLIDAETAPHIRAARGLPRITLPGVLAEFSGLRECVEDPLPFPGDRKSTRLNSSHANISYAVFCLKKKKKNTVAHYLLYHTVET